MMEIIKFLRGRLKFDYKQQEIDKKHIPEMVIHQVYTRMYVAIWYDLKEISNLSTFHRNYKLIF